MRKSFLLFFLTILISSCSSEPKESPTIYFSNASVAPISNIQCRWAEKHALKLPTLNPGESRGQSFMLKKTQDFFGISDISWTNANGEKITKEFAFREKNLPSIHDKKNFSYVQIYFGQNDLEILTNDSIDVMDRSRKMEILLKDYSKAYQANKVLGASQYSSSSLISVEEIPQQNQTHQNQNIYDQYKQQNQYQQYYESY